MFILFKDKHLEEPKVHLLLILVEKVSALDLLEFRAHRDLKDHQGCQDKDCKESQENQVPLVLKDTPE